MKKVLVAVLLLVTLIPRATSQTPEGNPFKRLGYNAAAYTFGVSKEFHDRETVVIIGNALFDTKKNEVIGFIDNPDSLTGLRPELQSMSVDPHCEKYVSVSPYVFCLNNPIKYIDPDGKNPIYDPDGNFLGTDNNGLQGHGIVMSSDNFKQGMSYKEAMSFNTKTSGAEANERIKTHWENLSTRPDWDGYLTLEEANDWYQNGNGEPLFVDLGKIDLSNIVSLGEDYIGQIKTFNLLLHSGSLNDGLVYGNVTFKRYSDHTVRAYSDTYDFDMKSWWNPLNWGRNAETVIGNRVAGQGIGFEINIYGSQTLKPKWPWTK